jgi:16S rRNA (uracil1498-N3)-methyltransferase
VRRFFYAISSNDNEHSDRNAFNKSNVESSYHPRLDSLALGSEVDLPDTIVHHWCRVLRANIGDQGLLFDGFGGEYQVQLQTISKKHATATLLAHVSDDRTAPIISKIGLVMSRGERMDYAIQKATELGVTAIQLLSSHHGEVSLKPAQVDKKLLHWQQIAIAACEQCGLNRPPIIFAPQPIKQWLQSLNNDGLGNGGLDSDSLSNDSLDSDLSNIDNSQTSGSANKASRDIFVSPIVATLSQDPYYQILNTRADLRVMMSVPAADQPLRPEALLTVLTQELPYIELLIGPEGGLSSEECDQAEHSGFAPWQIGARVLRTETAPIVALATLHALSR